MAGSDSDLPSLFQLIGPDFRRGESGASAVSVGASPSRPILREARLKQRSEENEGKNGVSGFILGHLCSVLRFHDDECSGSNPGSSPEVQYQRLIVTQ
jgi:hypothetical protein